MPLKAKNPYQQLFASFAAEQHHLYYVARAHKALELMKTKSSALDKPLQISLFSIMANYSYILKRLLQNE